MKKEYWTEFWKKHGRETLGQDPQTQVLRTLNKKPIDAERFRDTFKRAVAALRRDDVNRKLDALVGLLRLLL